jgi:hypothetical protein
MSYCGHLDFGLVADRDQMPDLRKMIDWLAESLDELRPNGRGRRQDKAKDPNAVTSTDVRAATGTRSPANRSSSKR